MWNRPCTKVMPAVIHPTKTTHSKQCCEYIVPEIHPSHHHHMTQHHYKHIHSFPQTASQSQQITHQHFVSPGAAPFAGPGVGPAGFGPGVGPTGAPGFGPGVGGAGFGPRPRPGFGW
ncbi:CotD family spore coat protein [Alkalihalobacterium sp. APHAB7]|uniref:spore coat protein n=1 Tax=Alkalihalobacterium sp. APHAB7 TaxID=3402081 RepID=UPI003AAFC225